MAWNNDDWVWVADGPTGGIYRNKYNPELYADGGGAVGTAETFGLGKSGGISYTTKVDPDGSVTGVPGATYQLGSNGSVSIISRPSSGGGSTTINYNTQAANDLGPNRYEVVVSNGSDGFPAGTMDQRDKLDGSVSNIKYPASTSSTNPADKNNDGLDDTTNLALGVFPSSKSPTGYIYGNGQYVWPNGAPYEGGSATGGRPDAPTWTGYGPKGQGTYYLDGPGGTPGTFIGATQAAASSGGSSSGGTIKISGFSGSSGGGGSSGSSSQYDTAGYRQMTQAVLEREAALAALKNQYQTPDTVSAEGQANRAFQAEQNALDRAERAKAQRASDLRDFSSAVSDTDMAKFQAVLYANGYNAGGTINNRLREDPNAFQSDLANVRAAGLLEQIRGSGATGSLGTGGAPAGGGAPSPGAATGTLPSTQQNQGGSTPTTPAQPQLPALLGNWRLLRDINGNPTVWQSPDTGAVIPWTPGETTNPIDWAGVPSGQGTVRAGDWIRLDVGGTPIGWVNAYTRERREYSRNDPTGYQFKMDAAQANGPRTPGQNLYEQLYTGADGRQYVMGTGDAQYQLGPDGQYIKVAGSGDAQLPVYIQSPQMADLAVGAGIPVPWTPGTFDAMGTWKPSGMAQPTNNITTPGGTPVGGNLLNDQINRGVDLGAAGGPTNEPTGTIQPRAVGAMAHGGGPVSGSLIVGDPQVPGRPNPELVTGENIRVTPLNHMPPPVAGSLMMGMRKAAYGTGDWWTNDPGLNAIGNTGRVVSDAEYASSSSAFARPPQPSPAFSQPVPPLSTATTAGSGTTTSPVAPTTPSTVSPVAPPQSSAPATGSLTPTGQTVQQPTAPAPATGGLGSITDIVNGTATPTSQALLDEIAQWRQNVPLPNVDPLSLEFQRLDPLTQQSILQARQTRSYIPVAAQQYEINKYRIGGGRALAGSLAF